MISDVIVIGGGLTGLTAAHTLSHLDKKVTLLEASDHLGGRLFWVTYLGGMVSLRGEENTLHPLHSILKRANITTKPLNPFHSETFDLKGNKILLSPLHQSLMPYYQKLLTRIKEAKRTQDTKHTLAEILGFQEKDRASLKNSIKKDSPEYWTYKFISTMVSQHTGASIEDVSLLELLQEQQDGEENPVMMGDSSSLVSTLFNEANATENLTTHLNTKIIKIEQNKSNSNANGITVYDNKGQTYHAKGVIVSVPFSILKKEQITFTPPLSTEKQTALANFGIAYYNSVILEFERFFWDQDKQYLFPNGPNIEDWPQFLNRAYFLEKTKPILIAQFSGKNAQFSNKSDEEIVNNALASLKRVYGDLPPLTFSHVSRFDTDPNIMGGSLFCTKLNRREDFKALQKPENNCYFAGDYVNGKQHGNVEAAFESGLRAALELDSYLYYVEHVKQKVAPTDGPRPH